MILFLLSQNTELAVRLMCLPWNGTLGQEKLGITSCRALGAGAGRARGPCPTWATPGPVQGLGHLPGWSPSPAPCPALLPEHRRDLGSLYGTQGLPVWDPHPAEQGPAHHTDPLSWGKRFCAALLTVLTLYLVGREVLPSSSHHTDPSWCGDGGCAQLPELLLRSNTLEMKPGV